MNAKDNSQVQCHAKYSMHALMHVLNEKGADEYNPLSKQEALEEIERRLKGEGRLHSVDYKHTPASRVARWENNLQFCFINLDKTGFAHRARGQWWITDAGMKFLEQKPTPDELYKRAAAGYQQWNADRSQEEVPPRSSANDEGRERSSERALESSNKSALESAQSDALEGVKERLKTLTPYEFQSWVAAVLETTEWNVHSVAPPGPDGGVDITATMDELGVQQPRLCVQVKHYINSEAKVASKDIDAIRGSIDQSTSTGMMVCSGGITRDAVINARTKSPHVTLLKLDDLLTIAERNYATLSDVGKRFLPLKPVYFVDPADDSA